MEKKSIAAIIIIIALLAVVGYLAYNQYAEPASNQVKVGAATFTLPEGFHQCNVTKYGDVNITNDYNYFFLKECGSDNITKYVKNYVKNKKAENKTVHIKNFTVNDTIVYKSTLENNTAVHYWFDYNGKVYTCYSWTMGNKIDNLISDLIKSLK